MIRLWVLAIAAALLAPRSAEAVGARLNCPDSSLSARIDQILRRFPERLDSDQMNFVVRRLMLLREVRNVTAEVGSDGLITLDVSVRPVIRSIEYEIVDGVFWERDLLAEQADEWELPMRYDQAVTLEIADRARQTLIAEGFRDAVATPILEQTGGSSRRLRVRLLRGPQYKIERLDVGGASSRPRSVRLVGRTWTDRAVEAAAESWAQRLHEQGYLDAAVRILCHATGSGVARCAAQVDRGPLTEIVFVGNRTFGTADLLDVLALDNGRRYDAADLAGLGDLLEDFYTAQGFYGVQVTTTIDDHGDSLRIASFHIAEGERARFVGVRVQGVPESYAADVSDVLQISARRLDVFFRGKERTVDGGARSEEVDRLAAWFREQGYLDAEVDDLGLTVAGGRAWWEIRVRPGARVFLGDVTIIGEAPGLSDALAVIRPGDVARPAEIESAVRGWLNEMRSDGYLEARARIALQRAARDELIVRVIAERGPRYYIADVAVDGLLRTDERAVLGVLPMRAGDVAEDGQLQEARRILIERRVFGRVDAAWELIDPATGWVTPLITVSERNAGEVEFGVLFTTEEGLGFDLRLAHNRIGGVFRGLQLIGSVLYQPQDYLTGAIFREPPWLTRWSLRYREPIPARFPVFGDMTGTLELNRNDRDIDWLTYNAAVGPTFEPLKNLNVNLSYVYEWFQVLKVKKYPLLAAGVAVTDQVDRLAGLRLTALWDNFDNRFDPRNGVGAFQEAQVLDSVLGGEHRLLRYEANVRMLRQTRGRIGFWSSLRGGVISAWSSEVPRLRTKVFRLGGSSSVRGYARDSVSPYTSEDARDGSTIVDDNGQPIAVATGGRWFVNGQGETRVLLTDSLDLALFLDAATITGFDGQRVNAAGTGAGMLYHTPAGPIRLDVGRRLIDLPTDTGGDFRVHFYVLTTF
ncbi:MAG: hypothetical protein D6761_08345 [Candidatus Dadabacteria bacterium]|nr:MAG: hypothetical protein D6761_08345 [Candidatus Dadabacteria bacterium]